MSLLPRLRSGKDKEAEELQRRVSVLQTKLQQCAQIAGRWAEFQREVTVTLCLVMLSLGFMLGVYRDSIKDTGLAVARAVGLANPPGLEAAEAAYRGSDYKQALALVRPLATYGDARAQALLGTLYYRGRGVTQDFDEAFRWFRLAADQGDLAAQFYLGFMYSEGEGVPRDDAESAKWFRVAAERGDPQSQYNIGLAYAKGQTGTPPDNVAAYMWFNLAAARFPASDTRRAAAITSRDSVATKMTPAEIAEAQTRSREWKAK